MTDTEMILQAINGINSRLDKVDERLEIMEEQNEKLTTVANITLDVLKEISDELVGQGLYHPSEKTKKAI